MATREADHQLEQSSTGLPTTSRPVIHATDGVISSGHYLTSMAGMRMMLAGGNAFDAVAAAAFAAAVVEPTASYSLGAESVFMLYHAQSGDLLELSGQGVAPAKATVDYYRSQGLDTIPTGPGPQAHLSFTVPGVVDALISLLERYGTKTLGEVLEPSIRYADKGIPAYEYMLDALDKTDARSQFLQYPPGGVDVFFRNGGRREAGSMVVQKALGKTLRGLVEAENGAAGQRLAGLRAARDAFYDGPIAAMIVRASQDVGGILELEDLAGYRARFGRPVKVTYAGYEVLCQNTWTQAPVLLQALGMLEGFDLRAMGHNMPAYVHTVVEALKLAFADRQAYYGDPEFASVPIDGLLSKEYAAERASLIRSDQPHPELPASGDPWRFSAIEGAERTAVPAGGSGDGSYGERDGTTHIAALDRDGNMVCATPSGGSFPKSVFFPDLGFALSTRIEMFNFEEGHPNALEPGKRPRTTLVNYILRKDGEPVMTVGCPGGDYQAQANLQLVLNTLVFGMDPQEAIEAPRFATDSVTNSFYPHVYHPGQLVVEAGIPDETVYQLKVMGHKVVRTEACGMGATVTNRDPRTGVLSAGGDPRRPCYAIGW